MSLESDVIVDRRRLRRKLSFWRVASALIAVVAVVAVGVYATPSGRKLTGASAIERVNIEGLIRSDQNRVEALERLGSRVRPRSSCTSIHRAVPPPGPNSSTMP